MATLHVSLTDPDSFNSIQAAYDALVAQKQNGSLTLPAEICVHGGVYHIAKPLQFKEDLPVVVRAVDGEEVVVDGGVEITGWKQTTLNGKRVFRAGLPDALDPAEINQFYVNGSLRFPAALPKEPDFFRVTDEVPFTPASSEEERSRFHYDGNDFDPNWYDPQNILVIMPHLWVVERAKIQSFDAETKTLRLQSLLCHPPLKSRSEYRFYNVREGLTEPGEYYIDRLEKAIYYIPRKGETLKTLSASIPLCGSLVEVCGAQWLTLEGLTFRHGGGFYPVVGANFDLRSGSTIRHSLVQGAYAEQLARAKKPKLEQGQASAHVPGVILFDNARNCVIRKCTVTNSGWYGVAVCCGCRNITIEESELSQLGGGAVRVGGGRWNEVMEKGRSELLTSHVIIRNNHIHHCSKLYYSAVGVIIFDARSCLIENNHIHDLYYSGISCGWSWSFRPQITSEIRIIRNHIHDLGKGVMSDMGGVYLLGVQPGTRVAENVIHDIESRYYGGWGLYTDEGSSHIVLERNLVYNCSNEVYHQHYGRENIVRENVFAFGRKFVIAITNLRQDGYDSPGEHYGKAISFYKNLLISDGVPFYYFGESAIFAANKFDSEGNFFCNISDGETVMSWPCPWSDEENKHVTIDWKEWQKRGYDVLGKLVKDNGLQNVAARDFRLKPSSAIAKLPWFQWLKKLD